MNKFKIVRIVDMGAGVPIMPRVELTDEERERLAKLVVVKLMAVLAPFLMDVFKKE